MSNSLQASFQFLPLLLDVIALTKDKQDELEVARAINIFNERILQCQRYLDQLPGLEMSRDQQKERFTLYEEALKHKAALLEKYKKLSITDNLPST
eukprot:TRINITY_DN7252_c0_g1_i2.p1 TRINITY_DN7252_c0_g1~~TRINITY_DN7252_c0_g1_i2.p1  ORF type:complete len:103 (-),score=21.37 TRINITY_DN7252_c0_g1_i2:81-368(-)